MSAMEKSLRRALEAGDASDPTFRESIYAASERALERMLAQKNFEEEAAHLQRTRLAETINRVEDEFYDRQTEAGAAADGPAQHDPGLSLDPAYADAHAYATHPPDRDAATPAAEADDFELEPVFDGKRTEGSGPAVAMSVAPAGGTADRESVQEPVRPSQRARAARAMGKPSRRGNAQLRRFLLLALAVVAAVAVGAYIVYASTGGAEGDVGASDAAAEWIDLFDGRRLEAVATPNGGRMEALDEAATGGRPAVRFTPAGEAASMTVAIGSGVASAIDGRKVVVEVAAGSPDGSARTFAVECRFGGRSVCGRRVFTTARKDETFVFDMDVPDGAQAGIFEIQPEADALASGLDVYAMRLRDG